jgi:hypothetical protein
MDSWRRGEHGARRAWSAGGALLLSLLLLDAGDLPARPKERVAEPSSVPGEKFKADLIAVIANADRIVVIEHAFEPGPGGELDLEHQKVYASKDLDKKQKVKFLASVKAMDARVPEASADSAECAFEPHHAIQFYDAAGWPRGTIEVSFECGEVFWEGSHGDVPAALAGVLETLVSSVGLKPRQDWAAR